VTWGVTGRVLESACVNFARSSFSGPIAAMVYNAYTTEDEKHFIEYLAVNNPDGKSRSGNKLYKELVENVRRYQSL
jgi:hypothetical protein